MSHSTEKPASGERPQRLGPKQRLAVAAAAILVLVSFAFPLWYLHLKAPQYPETLNLYVYAYKFEGSGNPALDDIAEINTLNHYIGMKEIHEEDFSELIWMPLALGLSCLLLGVAAVSAVPLALISSVILLSLTGVSGLGSAYFRLYQYAHNLDPDAPMKVPSFTPPLLGSNKLVNFMTYGYFGLGGYMLILAWLLAVIALVFYIRKRAI
jgi:hypothetical protein